jgi:UDP-N-acetylmuramate--alanine ligase
MGEALAAADLAIVTDVYGAREASVPGVTGAIVADAAARSGAQVIYEPDRARLTAAVGERLRSGDLVLTLGAGDVTRVGPELLARRTEP